MQRIDDLKWQRAETSLDYARIVRVIERIRQSAPTQLSLAELSEAAGLSEFHLQRLFSRWAGVSPKRFLQILTVEHAKERLQASADVLSTALDAGLSSPGRLHDLFVTLESVTPGEFKQGGEGVEIVTGLYASPLGSAFIAATPRGVCRVEFCDTAGDAEQAERRLRTDWPSARVREDAAAAAQWGARMFSRPADRSQRASSLSVLVRGTNFQVQVWRALLRIPAGQAISYQQLATWIGRPRAVRAVGTAVGANPIAYLIPCHRVLRASGALGGYRWGEARKLAARVWEHSAAEA